MKVICIILNFLIFSLTEVQNSLAWKLDDVFSGMSVNATSPHSYQDQQAGYYTGGGFSMRTKSTGFQPITLTSPSLNMGCSGIDLYMGSFSLISGNELVSLAKNIGSQSASYIFQLSLKTFAPQIETLLKDLRNLAMQANQFAVEDCQLTQSAITSSLSKNSAMYEIACQDIKNQGGMDYFNARKSCQNTEDAKKVAAEKQRNSNDELLLDNFNLLIIAARKSRIPEDLLDSIMSIAGTLVIKNGVRSFFDSLVLDEENFKAHIKGGHTSSYQCNNRQCTDITLLKNQQISLNSSYQGKANKKLKTMQSKMMENKDYSNEEIEFLSSISETFPIHNYLALEAVTGASILDKASDLSAGYMLIHYIGKIVSEVKIAIENLEGKQMNNEHFLEYLHRLDRVQDFLGEKYKDLMERAYRTEEKAILIEKHYMAKIR